MSTKKIVISLLILFAMTLANAQPVKAQSPITNFNELIEFLDAQPNIEISKCGGENLNGSLWCFAMVKAPKTLAEITGLAPSELDRIGVVQSYPEGKNIVYKISAPPEFCFPPGKSASEGESSNPPRQPAGQLAPVTVNPQTSPWTMNAIAMAGLVVVVLLGVAAIRILI